MKKIYILAAIVAFAFNANAQIDDNFDFYAVGDIDAQSPNWRTWSDAPGNAEDADVSTAQANSAPNSLFISTGNDMLLLFGDITNGLYSWQFDLYLEPGSTGFIGLMDVTADTFGAGLYFNDATAGDTGAVTDAAGVIQESFTFDESTWVTVTYVIDLDNDTLDLLFDGTSVYTGDNFLGGQLQAADIWDNTGANFYMDNVIFQEGLILGSDDFSTSNFSVYPNPVKDRLNIQTTNTVDAVTVYDVLGKVVLTATPGAVSPSIDMSTLSSGAYLVNITMNGSSKTVKVIK
ncbi:T9SS type A sorting domain-containing protein [Rasiella sp. SM2506]|uniref:T9SS type A sorting domain-containing protein n=1 Tax=Rasiella sp. SM2506 TaxID=3423914 RepID=UPI003D7AFF7C